MCNWTGQLPWHYLAGPVCMLRNGDLKDEDFPEGDQNCDVPDDGADPEFIKAVKQRANEIKATKDDDTGAKKFEWDEPWPSGLQICFRDLGDDKRSDFILTPGIIYFHRPGAPALGANVTNSDTALDSDCFMRTIDFLVACKMGRDIFLQDREEDDPPTGKEALERIKEVMAKDKDCDQAGIPSELEVCTETGLKTTKTFFECKDGHLTLHLGWDPDPTNGGQSCSDADKFTGFGESVNKILNDLGREYFKAVTARLMMVEWPCGATE